MRQQEKNHHLVYNKHEGTREGVCFYCGVPGNQRDHVPCLAAVEAIGADRFEELLWVDCCAECNVELGNKWLNSLEERGLYLISRYKNKYKTALAIPNWEIYELEELGDSLRKSIEDGLHFKQVVLKRIERLSERFWV